MANTITCPNCHNSFEPTAALDSAIENAVRIQREEMIRKWKEADAKKQQEFLMREESIAQQNKALQAQRAHLDEELNQRLQKALSEQEQAIQKSVHQKISEDFELQLKNLEEQKQEQAERLKESRLRELEFLKNEAAYKQKSEEQELLLQRTINQERERIRQEEKKHADAILREREEQQHIKTKELEKQLQDQKNLIEEMKRKSEQGSMQLQGDAKEIFVEELLSNLFPFDIITRSRKGVEETDLSQEVINNFRQSCGKVVYEIKNTKGWNEKWIDKLKLDMRQGQAEAAVIVTKTLPKDCDGFMEKDGIWVCNQENLRIVAVLLREGLVRVFEANKRAENVGDKKELLYKYLTSTEFRLKWEAILDVYTNLKAQLAKERMQMQKIFNEREKQLQILMSNSAGFIGDIRGLGGLEMMDIAMIGEEE